MRTNTIYNTNNTFGGVLTNYSFGGHLTMAEIADDIMNGMIFDKQCKRNAELRELAKMRKESK